MCTAATYQTKDFYFGRNLDYEFPYGEEVCVVPRNFPVPLRHLPELTQHHAIIGMAHVADNYPLFYDAVNETGLCIAGLNFVGNAAYAEPAGTLGRRARPLQTSTSSERRFPPSSPRRSCTGCLPTRRAVSCWNRWRTGFTSMKTPQAF